MRICAVGAVKILGVMRYLCSMYCCFVGFVVCWLLVVSVKKLKNVTFCFLHPQRAERTLSDVFLRGQSTSKPTKMMHMHRERRTNQASKKGRTNVTTAALQKRTELKSKLSFHSIYNKTTSYQLSHPKYTMRLVLSNFVCAALGLTLLAASTEGFTSQFSGRTFLSTQQTRTQKQFDDGTNTITIANANTNTELGAKKKKKALVSDVDFDAFDDEDEPMSKKDQLKAQKAAAKAAKKAEAAPKVDAKAAALAALDSLDFNDDEPMNAREKAKLEKQMKKESKKAQKEAAAAAETSDAGPKSKDKKKAAALKAIEEMERMEAEMASKPQQDDSNVDEFGMPKKKLSKKEMKALKKKEEKDAAKKAAKDAKKAARAAELEGEEAGADPVTVDGDGDGNAETAVSAQAIYAISIMII